MKMHCAFGTLAYFAKSNNALKPNNAEMEKMQVMRQDIQGRKND